MVRGGAWWCVASHMPRTAKKQTSKSAVCPLDPIVPHLAALLREAIAGQSENMDAREVVFWASWTLPLVCREARQLSQIDGLQWLWLFERHVQKQFIEKQLPNGRLVRRDECVRLCDGLPPWFDVHAQVQFSTRPESSKWYRSRQVNETNHVIRRCDMARRCATGCLFPHHEDLLEDRGHPENVRELNLRAYMQNPKDYHAPDLYHLVPTPVLQFVGFLRWWLECALLRDQHNRVYNLSCSARGCSRPAKVRAPKNTSESDHLYAPGYWPLVRCGVQTLRDDSQWPCNQLWCCNACEEAGTAEFFERVHCCSEAELEAPPRATRSTTRRTTNTDKVSPARLLTTALERNARVARRLREETKRPGGLLKHFPLNGEALEWYREMVVDALNVDVGILYAAAHLSSWPPGQRPARQLPNTANWRDTVHFYVRAICNVRRIYIRTISANRSGAKPRTASDLHTNPNTPPKWMMALKEELLDLF